MKTYYKYYNKNKLQLYINIQISNSTYHDIQNIELPYFIPNNIVNCDCTTIRLTS